MEKIGKKGIVTLAFDDAYLATYEHALDFLSGLNIRSTIAVPSSFIGKRLEKRAVAGKKELGACIEAGHEIASHGLTHTNLLKLSRMDARGSSLEIAESKKRLRRLLHANASSFIFPYIEKNYSRGLLLEASRYYKSARVTSNEPCFNKIPPKTFFPVVGFAVRKEHSTSYLNKLVDRAEKNNLWLIEVFHLVSDGNTKSAHRPKPYRYFTHTDVFKRHVEYILPKKMSILPQKAAIASFSRGG